MIPKVVCSVCDAELQRADKFCLHCGARIGWEDADLPPSHDVQEIACDLCGHKNPLEASFCEACGAALPGSKSTSRLDAKPQSREKKEDLPKDRVKKQPASILQSWRLTAVLGAIFVAVVIFFTVKREEPPNMHDHSSPQVEEIMKEIDALQKALEANPNDAQSLVRLANLLHDVQFYPRAVMMYRRYLTINPSDADARVDLGICYFEMAMGDTIKREEYLRLSKGEMEQALTYDRRHQLAHFNLGIVTLRSGNLEEANDWFKKTAEIDPNSPTGKRAQQLYMQHQFNNP